MQSLYELWVESCADDGVLIYQLEQNERQETGLFQTKENFLVGGMEYFTSPVYHVWVDGKCLLATTNYIEAYQTYMRTISLGGN